MPSYESSSPMMLGWRAFPEPPKAHRRRSRDKPISSQARLAQLRAITIAGLHPADDLSRYTIPVFVANGDKYLMVASEHSKDMAARLPDSRLRIYPDSGHGGVFQYHQEFVPEVLDFLGSTSGRDQQGHTPSTPGLISRARVPGAHESGLVQARAEARSAPRRARRSPWVSRPGREAVGNIDRCHCATRFRGQPLRPEVDRAIRPGAIPVKPGARGAWHSTGHASRERGSPARPRRGRVAPTRSLWSASLWRLAGRIGGSAAGIDLCSGAGRRWQGYSDLVGNGR